MGMMVPPAPPARRPEWVRDEGLTADWWAFHLEHPAVAHAILDLALPLARAGHRRLSIAMFWETIRYRSMIGARPGEEPWRLNNVYRPYYARWLMETELELRGIFATRESEAERSG